MRTFYLDDHFIVDGRALITGGDVHQITNVLRMKPGDQLRIRNFANQHYHGEIESMTATKITVLLEEPDRSLHAKELKPEVWLYLGIPRSPILDVVTRQITELGVSGLQLVEMERCEMKSGEVNLERLRIISLEAMEPCLQPMAILPPLRLKALDASKFLGAINLLAYEGESRPDFPTITEKRRMNLWVGPERGISLYDKSILDSLGFQSVSLSKQILRVDTAVLFLLAKVL